MQISCHKTGLKAILNFKAAGWFGKDLHKFDGFISDKKYQIMIEFIDN